MFNYFIVKEFFCRSFFYMLIFCFFSLYPMDRYRVTSVLLPEDAVCNYLLLLLNLSEIIAFGRTCKTYHDYCDIKKICESKKGQPCFLYLVADYDRSTRILAYAARGHDKIVRCGDERIKQNNTIMFENVYSYCAVVRDNDLARLNGNKQVIKFSEKISMYRKYYKPKRINKRLREQICDAIDRHDRVTLEMIMRNYHLNILQLFPKSSEKRREAFNKLCGMYASDTNNHVLLALMPTLEAEKNIAVKYLFKFGSDDLLCYLCHKNFIVPTGRDEYQCTPLHYAALLGLPKLTKLLIDRGADLYARNVWQKVPFYYACRLKHFIVADQIFKAYDYNRMISYIMDLSQDFIGLDQSIWMRLEHLG